MNDVTGYLIKKLNENEEALKYVYSGVRLCNKNAKRHKRTDILFGVIVLTSLVVIEACMIVQKEQVRELKEEIKELKNQKGV